MLCAPTVSAGDGADFTSDRFGPDTVLVLEEQVPGVVQVGPGVGGLGPPVGSIEAELVNDWPRVPESAETTTFRVLVPPPDAIVPAKLQVTRPLAFAHDQPVPLAETKLSPAGNWSFTCAVVAAIVPVFVTVNAYVLWAPTVRSGVGAPLAIERLGARTGIDVEQNAPPAWSGGRTTHAS